MRARILIVSLLAVLVPASAWACLNAMTLSGDEAVRKIKKAEKLLARGKNAKAARLLNRHRIRFSDQRLRRRANIIRATASIRQRSRVELATQNLARLYEESEHDPVLMARYAEALALDDARRARSRELLEDLAKRDLMPDAFAYRALATLRHRDHDGAGRDKALARCRKMTKRKRICRVEKSNPKAAARQKAAKPPSPRARRARH